MHRWIVAPVMLGALVVLVAPTQAANLGWLRGSIIEQYSDEDRRILGSELLSALDFQPPGVEIRWYNWRTGHWGSITPLERTERDGAACRRATLENHLGNRSARSTYTVCKRPGEDWMLVSVSL